MKQVWIIHAGPYGPLIYAGFFETKKQAVKYLRSLKRRYLSDVKGCKVITVKRSLYE